MEEMKISPIFYMGNKKKLIKKGLTEMFPKDINTFVDLFGGSGIVGMNVEAKSYIVNDTDLNVVKLYNIFKDYPATHIINHIEKQIEKYNLPKERTKRNVFTDNEKLNKYKKSYMMFREIYNKDRNMLDMYTLMFFAFSQQFRFNSKGDFNMPYGNDCFSDKNKLYIQQGCDYFSKANITQCDFRKYNIVSENDFIYLDPPYLNTTATYNENGGWTEKDELDLYEFCERLNKQGIKFGLSNVFTNKGTQNNLLIDWCDKMNWNVYKFDKFSYMACGKGNSEAQEVYICNY